MQSQPAAVPEENFPAHGQQNRQLAQRGGGGPRLGGVVRLFVGFGRDALFFVGGFLLLLFDSGLFFVFEMGGVFAPRGVPIGAAALREPLENALGLFHAEIVGCGVRRPEIGEMTAGQHGDFVESREFAQSVRHHDNNPVAFPRDALQEGENLLF